MDDIAEAERRHRFVADKLANELEVRFRDYRTYDGKELTEGEIMSAIGLLIGRHCKNQDRVTSWMSNITVSAVTANNNREPKQ
jgi:hypothetical protein